MPQNLADLYRPGIDTIEGATRAALELFLKIRKHHGDVKARRIFAMWGTPPTPRRLAEIKNLRLFDLLDLMKPRPNVMKLARELARRNETLPRPERYGPSGSFNHEVLERHIFKLVAKRKKCIKAGTWTGPFPP